MRVTIAAALTLLLAAPSLAQPSGETAKSPPSPCDVLKNRSESQKEWWKAAIQWAEVTHAPIAGELNWEWPLQVAQAVHGDSYYLVAHARTLSSATLPSAAAQLTCAACSSHRNDKSPKGASERTCHGSGARRFQRGTSEPCSPNATWKERNGRTGRRRCTLTGQRHYASILQRAPREPSMKLE